MFEADDLRTPWIDHDHHETIVVFVIGVAGSGKTTVGRKLADVLPTCEYVDADDVHSQENREKMTRAEPLTDADRWPWLRSLNEIAVRKAKERKNVVISCSALRAVYRCELARSLPLEIVWFLYLDIDFVTATKRLKNRHYFRASLLQSQFDTLEPPSQDLEDIRLITVDATERFDAQQLAKRMGAP